MYAERTAQLGQSALAITDHGTLSGVLYHVQACEAVDVKPIVGMEAYFRPDVQADRDAKAQYDYTHLVLLAKNYEGFQNLMQLSTWAWKEGHYSRPAVEWSVLRKFSKGIIASSSCVNGYLPRKVLDEQFEDATTYIRAMQDIFGDDFYLEIQPHDFEKQKIVNKWLVDNADQYGIPVVAAADAHYPEKGWHTTQQVMLMMKNIHQDRNPTEWLMSEEELHTLMVTTHPLLGPETVAEAIANSKVIADRCEHYEIDKSPKIPKATKSTLEAERVLREWCKEGLERIGKTDDPMYLERIETEFKTLRKLKVMDYFVIVGDMVRWAKSEGIRVGPGRGSAAGCLINYLIGITAVDPIGYGLLFERFMNDYRTELPDIDIDFQDDRRDEVKQYLRTRWGDDYVVDIAAFQSFSHKSAIKDVGRALEIPYPVLESATKTIPDVGLFGVDLDDLADQEPKIKQLFEDYPILYTHASRLFGQIKGLSKHAAAVIVTNRPAVEVIPLMRDTKENMVTQWSERADAQLISPYGFLKIDCLSSSGLTIQDKALKLVEERRGEKYDFEDLSQFPVNEAPEYAEEDIVSAFADGALLGIFQFGASHGIKALLREIKPTSLEHVIAANALYRPGTLSNGMADEYARRKNGKPWTLAHPSLEPFLAYTFGIMVFQEQVMQMYQALGKDVQPAESAIFLKVVGKGIARDLHGREKVAKYYDKFAAGCEEKGIPRATYDKIWEQILQMTTYAFNKSHSTGYALQAYQDMWLKQRKTLEEYSALLTVESRDAKKIPGIIRESKLFGISVKPPDINSSETGFAIDGNSIRFGLLAVKGLGEVGIGHILDGRPFKDYQDFYERVPKAKVNKNVKKALLNCGAFDSIGGRQEWELDDEANPIPLERPWTDTHKASMEKQIIGFTLSKKSEIDEYRDVMLTAGIVPLDKLYNERDGTEVNIGGEVAKVKEIKTKNGDRMGFATLSFGTDDYEVTFFPREYTSYSHLLTEGQAILVNGKWDSGRQTTVANICCTAHQLAEELKREGQLPERQATRIDRVETKAVTDEAIERGYSAIDDAWKEAAYNAAVSVARQKQFFIGDDIWATGLYKPKEARVLGGVMRRVAADGVCRKTGRMVKSDSPKSHSTYTTEWESLIYAS